MLATACTRRGSYITIPRSVDRTEAGSTIKNAIMLYSIDNDDGSADGPVHDRLDVGTHLLRLMALLAMYTITFSQHG